MLCDQLDDAVRQVINAERGGWPARQGIRRLLIGWEVRCPRNNKRTTRSTTPRLLLACENKACKKQVEAGKGARGGGGGGRSLVHSCRCRRACDDRWPRSSNPIQGDSQ